VPGQQAIRNSPQHPRPPATAHPGRRRPAHATTLRP